MSVFVDQMLLQLSDPTQLQELLAPTSDASHTRLRALLDAVYELPYAKLHDVLDVDVRRQESQRSLFPPNRTSGTWTQTIPGYARTDVVYEEFEGLTPVWMDVSAEMNLTLVLEVDPGEVESVLTRQVSDFNTLEEFRAHFRFIDLDAFMAKHDIATVEELKDAYHYLLTEIRLRAPTPFDPDDPANQHRYTLNVAILIRESIDVAATLRDAKLARAAVERTLTYRREVDTAEVRTLYAPVVIFSQTALNGLPFDADALRSFFATEHILALFVTPS